MFVLVRGHHQIIPLSILMMIFVSQPIPISFALNNPLSPFPFLWVPDAMNSPLEFMPWGSNSNQMVVSVTDIGTEPVYKIVGKTGPEPAGFSAEVNGNWTSLLINILNVTKMSDTFAKEDSEVQVFFTLYLENVNGIDKYVSFVDGPIYAASSPTNFSYEQIKPGYYLVNLDKYKDEGLSINRIGIGIQKQSLVDPIEFSVQFW